jgi:iron-sulfur cluster assembly protein
MAENLVVDITLKAVEEIQKIKTANSVPESHGLRVGIKGGGCCGMSYVLGFEEKSGEEDTSYETNGLKVVMDKTSADYLSGAQLDFQENEFGRGFVFNHVKQEQSHAGDGCNGGSCESC